jgi:hypothetical protein
MSRTVSAASIEPPAKHEQPARLSCVASFPQHSKKLIGLSYILVLSLFGCFVQF